MRAVRVARVASVPREVPTTQAPPQREALTQARPQRVRQAWTEETEVPSGSALAALGQEALLLAVAVSLPVVAIAALVGLLVAVLQAATQVQDATLAHLPRLVVVAVVLAVLAPWMGSEIAAFAVRAFHGG
jgi:type III secretion HrpO family protein